MAAPLAAFAAVNGLTPQATNAVQSPVTVPADAITRLSSTSTDKLASE